MKRAKLFWLSVVFLFPYPSLHGGTTYDVRNSLGTSSNSFTGYEAIYFTSPHTSIGDSYHGFVTFGDTLTISAGSYAIWLSMGRMLSTIIFGNALSSLYIGGHGLRCGSGFGLTGPGCIGVDTADSKGPGTMWLSGDLTIAQAFTLQYGYGGAYDVNDPAPGQLIIDGGGRTVTIASGGSFTINTGDQDNSAVGSSLRLQNMNLVIATTTPFSFHNNKEQSKLVLQDVNIYLDPSLGGSSVLFDNSGSHFGVLTIKGKVTFNGQGQTFNYNSNTAVNTSSSSIYIDDNSSLTINRGVIFQLSSDIASRSSKIFLKGTSSTLMLNGCTFQVPNSGSYPGVQLERGNVIFDNKVILNNANNTDANKGFILGDGVTVANNVAVKVCSGAQVIVSGFLFHRPA